MMLRRSLAPGSLLAAALVVACQEPTATTGGLQPTQSSSAASAQSQNGGLVRGWPSRSLSLPRSVPTVEQLFSETGNRTINPDQYVCSDATPVIRLLNAELSNTIKTEQTIFFTMYDRLADVIPTYEALFFQSSATPQSFGYAGAFTQVMAKVERDVKSFWDIPAQDIQVVAMHGTMLADAARTYQTYRLLGFKDKTAVEYSVAVRDALLASQTMNGGNYAFWTFNAVSYRHPAVGKKIVMGDGILESFATLGFADVAPQAIFAHEYAHQIQYEKNYFADVATLDGPEQTRYTELMADAMSAYFLTHARGEALNKFRVQEFLDVFYQIGDCAFDNDGHHGTPNQRFRAAQLGFNIADQYQQQGHILTAQEFRDAFVAEYPTIVAPDAT
jgi:hypothetical protein